MTLFQRVRRLALLTIGILLLSTTTQAVGTVVLTSALIRTHTGLFRRYTVAWTSTNLGAVSGNAFSVAAGRLISIRFTPGGTTPSDLYDVVLTETGGLTDLTGGLGADRSNASVSLLQWEPQIFLDGTRTLDVVVSNAGNAKTGTVVILVQVQ